MSLTPPVSASGLFKLASPFDSKLITDVSYTCIAVRRFADIQKLGYDPFTIYYQTNGIDQLHYQADLSSNESIVTLRSNGGDFIYVPTSYILSYPDMGGISYTSLVLGINLGAIPNYLDLSAIKAKIQNVVHDSLGITPDIQQAAISETKNMSISDHTAIESARQAAIVDKQTDYAKYLAAAAQRDALQTQLIALQQYIATGFHPQADFYF